VGGVESESAAKIKEVNRQKNKTKPSKNTALFGLAFNKPGIKLLFVLSRGGLLH